MPVNSIPHSDYSYLMTYALSVQTVFSPVMSQWNWFEAIAVWWKL